jgi:pimeloyl-ACP methyl ester carboxylesterase
MIAGRRTMDNTTSEYFHSSLGNIAYIDTRVGDKTLIFVHGLPTSKELWSPVLPHLDTSYRIVAFDLNQYGQSEKPRLHITHKDRANILDQLRDHLMIGQFYLIAHDLGSSVAIDYMGRYSKHVKKLILISPPIYPDFHEPFLVRLLRKPGLGKLLVVLFKKLLIKFGIQRGMVHKERLTPELLAAFSEPFVGLDGRMALLRILHWGSPRIVFKDYPNIVRSITIPTLIIQGRYDPYIPHSQVIRLRNDIVDSKLIFIEDGGHFLPVDTPVIIAREINTFI